MKSFKQFLLTEAIPLSDAKKGFKIGNTIIPKLSRRFSGAYKIDILNDVFDKKDRLVYDIDISINDILGEEDYPIYKLIKAVIESINTDENETTKYEIPNIRGYLSNTIKKVGDKRDFKISKIILEYIERSDKKESLKSHLKEILKQYINDPMRQNIRNDEVKVVISRHPYDVAGMSTDRGWTSCMRLRTNPVNYPLSDDKGTTNADKIAHDIKYGTIIAYLVKSNDIHKENNKIAIRRPISRILIKPYIDTNDSGKSKKPDYAFGVSRMYGTNEQKFYEFVKNWIDENLNKKDNYYGYEIHPELYSDSVEYLNRKIKYTDDGTLILSNNTIISGNLNLSNVPITNLGNLQSVKGNLDLYNTSITSLGNLQSVGGHLYLNNTPITNLGNIQSIGRNLNLSYTPITSLGNLQSIGGNLILNNTPITSLGNLQSVGGNLNLYKTPITDLGNLQSAEGDLDLSNTPITDLGNLQSVEGNLNLSNTSITSLGNLQSVEGNLNLSYTPITSLGNLQSVEGNLNLSYTPITDLGNLQSIGRNLYLSYTSITDLGNLQSVKGNLYLNNTPITSLGNLQSIGGDLNLSYTPITSLGNLKSVRGYLYLYNTPITSLYNLKSVGGNYFEFK